MRVPGLVQEVTSLLVPLACAGCGAPDVVLCDRCRPSFGMPRRCEDRAPRLDRTGPDPLPVWTLADYAGPVRRLVPAWKDGGRTDLTGVLAEAMRDGAATLRIVLEAAAGEGIAVVPVPSRPGARRRRGGDRVGHLARAVVEGLQASGGAAVLLDALVARRGGADQAGLTARARGGALVRLPHVRHGVRDRWCVLVDDVLTTGSTLAGAADALARSGGRPLAGVVLAATPAPRDLRPLPRGADGG